MNVNCYNFFYNRCSKMKLFLFNICNFEINNYGKMIIEGI